MLSEATLRLEFKKKLEEEKWFSPTGTGTTQFKLLYQGTRDGMTPAAFHEKCDDKESTLVLIKAKEGDCVFGGYTGSGWFSPSVSSSRCWDHIPDPTCFLFHVVNPFGDPITRMSAVSCDHYYYKPPYTMVCNGALGPWFGFHGEIVLRNTRFCRDEPFNHCKARLFLPPLPPPRCRRDDDDRVSMTFRDPLGRGHQAFVPPFVPPPPHGDDSEEDQDQDQEGKFTLVELEVYSVSVSVSS